MNTPIKRLACAVLFIGMLFPHVVVADRAMTVTRPADRAVDAWHLYAGVPFAKGELRDASRFALYRDGNAIPTQTRAVATWGPNDESIRWLAVDFVDALEAGKANQYTFDTNARLRTTPQVHVVEHGNHFLIDNGRLKLRVNKASLGFNLFNAVTLDGRNVWQPAANTGAYLVDGEGVAYRASLDRSAEVTVETVGPLMAVIRAEGWFVNPDVDTASPEGEPRDRPRGGFCRYVTRLYIAADQPRVRVQHTFINTEDSNQTTWRDIGLSLPVDAGAMAHFGGVKGEHAGQVHLLQKSFDTFEVKRDGDAQAITTGVAAEGWMRAGDIAVGVRDFRKNYPKELEVLPGGEMRVHLWPAHGSPRIDTAETFSDDNAWRLPFVHSGKALDFRVPQCLDDAKAYPELHGGGYIDAMYKSNAMGVAKTHDLLICFGADDPAPAMAAFQADPHVLPDPQYIASTRVFGEIAAADPQRRPLAEHRWRGGMHWLIRVLEGSQAFGMWIYGDTNTDYHFRDGKIQPRYRRLWASTHYNPTRVAWWTYWRSGDPVILDHARANTRHIIDVDVCHWTNTTFAEHPDIHDARKHVGGLCDYKGVVHWHAGTRASYNACIDFMLYDYYLSGNRRAWDVAMEHGYYTANQPDNMFADFGRGASGQADTLVELYKATWDPAVGERLHQHADTLMTSPRRSADPRLDWAPWLCRYWDLTRDPKVRDFIIDWVENDGDPRVGDARLHLWAYAYYITGDLKYARHCAKSLLINALSTPVRDDEFDATLGRFVKNWIFGATDEMIAAKAAADVQLTLADFQPGDGWSDQGWNLRAPYTLWHDLVKTYFGGTYPWPADPQERFRFTSYIYHDGTPKSLWLGAMQLHVPHADTFVHVYNPSGARIKTTTLRDYHVITWKNEGGRRVAARQLRSDASAEHYPREDGKMNVAGVDYETNRAGTATIATRPFDGPDDFYPLSGEQMSLGPDDPKGFYKIVHTGQCLIPTPLAPPSEKVWVKVGEASTMTLSGFQFFWVPANCESFELSFLPSYQLARFHQKLRLSSGAVLNPDAETVAYIRCGLETQPQVVRIDVKPEHRGKAWCIAGENYSVVGMKGAPSFISPTLKTFDAQPYAPGDQP